MRTDFALKNFRVFDSEGASFKMTPITILTGCNSSGKSSVVKSMVLLRDCISRYTELFRREGKFNPSEHYVDFTKEGLNLQSFKSTVNRDSHNKEIIVSYSADGIMFPYTVEIAFQEKANDIFNYGWLSRIRIYSQDNDDFLRASLIGDSLQIDYLNMNNRYLTQDFIAAAYSATLSYLNEQVDNCYNEDGDYIEDQDQYDFWNDRKEKFVAVIQKDSDFERAIATAYVHLNRERIPDKYKDVFYYDYSTLLHNLDEYSLFLFFPVLKHFVNVDREDVRSILLSAKEPDFLVANDGTSSFTNDATLIADAFEASGESSFLDYYLSLENNELSSIAIDPTKIRMFADSKIDFISAASKVAMISFDEHNPIHFFASFDSNKVDLNFVYRFLSKWQFNEGIPEGFMTSSVSTEGAHSYQIIYQKYCSFLSFLLEKLLLSDHFTRLKYVGNFQSEVKRLYNFDDYSNNFGKTIKEYLFNKSKLESLHQPYSFAGNGNKLYRPGTFTNKWLRKLGIGHSLNIVEDEDRIGAKVYIRKNNSGKGFLLADEGYGISQLVAFLLHIENEILVDKLLSDDFLGFSSRNNEKKRAIPTLALEEPEVSLHPSMQSLLADIFYDAYRNYDIHFIVETHSEYLIRRTQAIIADYKSDEEFENRPFSVYYIGPKGKAYEMEYTKSGRFNNSFGEGFFDEASRSSLRILKRERRMRYE